MVESLKSESLAFMAQKISNRFALAERMVARGNCEDNSKLVNQTQRFELWAKNLGLYHLGHSSLDYRFRDAPSLFEYTVGLLRNLEDLLAQLMDTLNPGHLSSVDAKNTTYLPIGSHGQVSDDSEEDDFESSDDESVTDLLLTRATATIDKLYRLSFKIRNPAMRLGFSRSLKYQEFDQETGVNLIDQFQENDQRHLEQLFASYRSTSPEDFEKDFLVRRLAKANTRRRQQFGYWKKRRAQFETVSKTEIIEEMAPDLIPRESEDSPNPNVPVVRISPSRPSTATHLDVSRVKLDDNASMISSSTIVNMKDEGNSDLFFIPPPPKHLWDGEEFECPYCFTLCPRKMLHQTNWQTHILRDLRPYICTYEDCRDADLQYDTVGDWINHETFTHQRKSDRTSSENGNLSIQVSRKCPFCLEHAGPYHIATHLRRVACFALPRSIGPDDGSLQGSQISGRVDSTSNYTRVSEIRSDTSLGGAESASEVDYEVNLKNNPPLTLESLYQQQPDPKDEASKVNRFLEGLESEPAASYDTPLGIDITETDDIDRSKEEAIPPPSGRKRVSYDAGADAVNMQNALNHRTIDNKTIIQVLPRLTSDEILLLRAEYKNRVKLRGKGINLAKHLRLKLGNSSFGKIAYATALGRWESEAYWANCYYQVGTSRRELLIESLIGRSNAAIREIKSCFRDTRYNNSLERCMRAELKADKFRTAVLLALEERRQDEREPIDARLIRQDVGDLHKALVSREGGETAMINIVVLRSDTHLREILREYEAVYRVNFAKAMITKSRNLVGETLAHVFNGAINRPMRDAILLHQAVRESRNSSERSELLISRLVRLHWEPGHLKQVKSEYRRRYNERVEEAIAEEVMSSSGSSEWGEFCIELVRSSV